MMIGLTMTMMETKDLNTLVSMVLLVLLLLL